jgi:hypothetical protein
VLRLLQRVITNASRAPGIKYARAFGRTENADYEQVQRLKKDSI